MGRGSLAWQKPAAAFALWIAVVAEGVRVQAGSTKNANPSRRSSALKNAVLPRASDQSACFFAILIFHQNVRLERRILARPSGDMMRFFLFLEGALWSVGLAIASGVPALTCTFYLESGGITIFSH